MDTQTHPEDEIYRVKTFIKELSTVQENYLDKLSKSLRMTKEGEEWLFDYVFNNSEDESFEEYLEKYGRTFGEMK